MTCKSSCAHWFELGVHAPGCPKSAATPLGEEGAVAEVAGGAFTSPPAADHILAPLTPASTVRLVALLVLVFGTCAGLLVLLAMEVTT